MKKKIIIISVLIVLLVIIGVTSYCVSKNKISNIQVNEDPILANDLSSVETGNDEKNTENLIVEEEQNLDESNIEIEEQETETSIQTQTTQPVKSSSKATSKVETQKAETKSEVVKETSTTKEETPTKVDIPSTISNEPKQETKVEEKPTRCTNNSNHGMNVGNSGKWFNLKQEAVNYYDSIIKTWGDKWENFEIDSETYDKNCPYGYEVWTCPFCGKWTINFYYR